MIATDRALLFRPDVVATILDEGAVLLDLETKYFYELNRTGWDIAARFETGATVESVLAQCRAQGAPESADKAIRAVIDALVADGLVAESAAAGGAPLVVPSGTWVRPTIEKQAEPLQRIIISAFDPSVPLVE